MEDQTLKVSFITGWLLGLIVLSVPMLTEGAELDPQVTEHITFATVGILSASHDNRSTTPDPTSFSIRASGTHIGKGYILTARHAIERQEGGKIVAPQTIHVMTSDFYELTAQFIGINAFLDIALYRIPEEELPATLRHTSFSNDKPLSGQEVFTVGYPLGWGPALSFGRVGNPHTFLGTIESRLIQVDLSACSGNSGGGLFDYAGKLVGMVHAIIQTETTQGERRCSRFGFAVPGPVVSRTVQSLINGTPVKFPTMGIQLSVIKQGQRWAVAVKKATGPARRAGFKKGDILLAINDHPIQSAAHLKSFLIEHTQPGEQVTVTVLREHTTLSLPVILGGK